MVIGNQVSTHFILIYLIVNANERIELEYLRKEVGRLKSYKRGV